MRLGRLDAAVDPAFGGTEDLVGAGTADRQGIEGASGALREDEELVTETPRSKENASRPRFRRVPILGWLPRYERPWLRFDVIAGLTIVALLIPEGMAYAQMAGVPPQTAFYAAPIGLLAYAAFGSSRQLVVAVSSAVAVMSFATVSLIAEPNTPEFITLTAALALLAGVISALAGLLKLGRIAQFFSDSVMAGFITGLALLISVKQVPKLLGIEGGEGNFWERLWDVLIHLSETHPPTLIVGVACLLLLIWLERSFEKIPAALAALVFGIAISTAFGLEAHGVAVVGEIPAGLAPPRWPSIGLEQWGLLLPGAFGIALVAFAEAVAPARSFAAAHGYRMDPNQELIGLGAANTGAGLFQGFPIGSSLSKSAASDRAGGRSQVAGIVAAALTAVVALFLTWFFSALPEATLGAIVIVAVSGMVKVSQIKHLYRVRRADFALAVIALLAVLTFETLEALLIAVVASLVALVWRASRPRVAVLGRRPDGLAFGDVRRHPQYKTLPGLLVVRPEASLFFANAAGVRETIIGEVDGATPPFKAVILDLEATTDLDVPSADVLGELSTDLSARHVRLMLAHVIGPVREMLDRAGAMKEIHPDDVFEDEREAVLEYLAWQEDDVEVQALLVSGLRETRDLVKANLSAATPEKRAGMEQIAEGLREAVDGDATR